MCGHCECAAAKLQKEVIFLREALEVIANQEVDIPYDMSHSYGIACYAGAALEMAETLKK